MNGIIGMAADEMFQKILLLFYLFSYSPSAVAIMIFFHPLVKYQYQPYVSNFKTSDQLSWLDLCVVTSSWILHFTRNKIALRQK